MSTEHSAANLAVGRDMDKAIKEARTLASDLDVCLSMAFAIDCGLAVLAGRVDDLISTLGT